MPELTSATTITADSPEAGKQFREWTGADGLTYVKLKLTSGETVYAINYGDRWSPASNVGKKYNLYGNFLGMYEDGSSPLFAIYFAVSK